MNEGTRGTGYFLPSPAGAYHAVSMNRPEPAAQFILQILQCHRSPRAELNTIMSLSGLDRTDTTTLIRSMQQAGWLEGFDRPLTVPNEPFEILLPDLLPALSTTGKVVLADPQGFCVANTGYPEAVAEELAALSASLCSIHDRNIALLQDALGLGTSAWGVVNASGNSQVGFWPVHIGINRFVLIIDAMPRLHHPSTTRLLWALVHRYGRT